MNERLALLAAYLDADLDVADRLAARLAEQRDLPADVEASWKGYTLHNLYGALEQLFERIARTFENQVEDPARYHAELLRRMTLAIPQVRPAVLSRPSYEALNELRAFRHVFRHAYDYELNAERVERMVERARAAWPGIHDEVRRFRATVLIEGDLGGA